MAALFLVVTLITIPFTSYAFDDTSYDTNYETYNYINHDTNRETYNNISHDTNYDTHNRYHTVTFIVNNGATNVFAPVTTSIIVPHGGMIPTEFIPAYGARRGFYFAGWYNGHPADHVYVDGDITFTAQFRYLFHHIYFIVGQGGTWHQGDGVVVKYYQIRDGWRVYGESALRFFYDYLEEALPCWRFAGWDLGVPGLSIFDFVTGFDITQSMRFTALFETDCLCEPEDNGNDNGNNNGYNNGNNNDYNYSYNNDDINNGYDNTDYNNSNNGYNSTDYNNSNNGYSNDSNNEYNSNNNNSYKENQISSIGNTDRGRAPQTGDFMSIAQLISSFLLSSSALLVGILLRKRLISR
jgi:hypothetical protein